MGVDAISFSAHADFPQTSEFIDELQPKHVVLVHGEATEMGRLKRALEQRASATGQTRALYMPRVTQPVHISHKTSYTAKVGPWLKWLSGLTMYIPGTLGRPPRLSHFKGTAAA